MPQWPDLHSMVSAATRALSLPFTCGPRTPPGFIGNWNFALSYTTQTSMSGTEFTTFGWHQFFFQWSFCVSTVMEWARAGCRGARASCLYHCPCLTITLLTPLPRAS